MWQRWSERRHDDLSDQYVNNHDDDHDDDYDDDHDDDHDDRPPASAGVDIPRTYVRPAAVRG